jgi:hypothetical protein
VSVIKDRWRDIAYWWTFVGASVLLSLFAVLVVLLVLAWIAGALGEVFVLFLVLGWIALFSAWLAGSTLMTLGVLADAFVNFVTNLFDPEVDSWAALKRDVERNLGHVRGGIIDGLRRTGQELRKQFDRSMEPLRRLRDWIGGWFD